MKKLYIAIAGVLGLISTSIYAQEGPELVTYNLYNYTGHTLYLGHYVQYGCVLCGASGPPSGINQSIGKDYGTEITNTLAMKCSGSTMTNQLGTAKGCEKFGNFPYGYENSQTQDNYCNIAFNNTTSDPVFTPLLDYHKAVTCKVTYSNIPDIDNGAKYATYDIAICDVSNKDKCT